MKDCKHLSVDDCCMEDNPCGLTPCQHINNCYYKQLLAEQAKSKEIKRRYDLNLKIRLKNKKYNIMKQKLLKTVELEQAKNKKLVEALDEIRWYKAIGKDVHKIQQIAAHAVTGIDILENGLRGIEVNNAK